VRALFLESVQDPLGLSSCAIHRASSTGGTALFSADLLAGQDRLGALLAGQGK
jgi:hypothetical protein